MANYLDSAYIAGVNPLNQGNLNSQQVAGLGALVPQSMDLFSVKPPTVLNPSAAFPTPQYSQSVTDYNQGLASLINQENQAVSGYKSGNHFGGMTPDQFKGYIGKLDAQAHGLQGPFSWAVNGQYKTTDGAPTPDLNPKSSPYFDPYYPNESMLALKNWLAPQLEQGEAAGLHARGLDYSGVKAYADKDLARSLDQLSPTGIDPAQAQKMDFQGLFGPPAAAGLDNGSSQIAYNSNAGGPLYSLLNNGAAFPSPGYFYDPNSMPDASKMPWLAPVQATQPTQPKQTGG